MWQRLLIDISLCSLIDQSDGDSSPINQGMLQLLLISTRIFDRKLMKKMEILVDMEYAVELLYKNHIDFDIQIR